MAMLATMLLVGLGSYLLRVVPLLLVDRVRLPPRTEQLLGHAVLAAMAGLLATVVVQLAKHPVPDVPGLAPWLGLAAGAGAALARQSMGRVTAAGMAAYVLALAAVALA
ncbi:MAG: AzlD domain-containing protein [Actinomycetes bacterium]